MKNSLSKERVYEVQFEQLDNNKEIEKMDNKKDILNAQLELVATIGGCKKSIRDILDFKYGDIITLDKMIDEDLNIQINDEMVAKGESVILDNKLGIRISKFENNRE